MAKYVAVYGSLRKGMQAENKMARMEFVGSGVIDAALYALGWYPGIKLGTQEGGSVVVDVFKFPDDDKMKASILFDLDGYEGFSPDHPENSLFVRKTVPVKGLDVLAFVYEYNYPVNRAPLVESGDWVEYRKENPL